MSHRERAEAAAKAWEKHAHAERYIETRLHPRAMGWLVDEIEKALGAATPMPKADQARPGADDRKRKGKAA